MRIALTSPTFWPYARRGERYVNGFARYLVNHGHDVSVITSKPGRARTVNKDAITISYNRGHVTPFMSYNYRYGMVAWSCFRSLLRQRFDTIQSLFYVDAFGASCSKLFSRTKHIFYVPNCDPFHWSGRIDKYMFERVIRSAVLLSPSKYLQDSLERTYGYKSELIPPGTDTEYFAVSSEKDFDRPNILCMAELGDARKRVPLLIKAFQKFKAVVPHARLQLSGQIIHKDLPRLYLKLADPYIRESIEIIGVGKEKDVPALYANAAMTVLPSLKEPFGMVLVESLAAGTPVVATRDGGIPEIIDNALVGVLFEGEGEQAVDALFEAMLNCLALARDPATSASCRGHSKRYDWTVIGPQLEALHQSIV